MAAFKMEELIDRPIGKIGQESQEKSNTLKNDGHNWLLVAEI